MGSCVFSRRPLAVVCVNYSLREDGCRRQADLTEVLENVCTQTHTHAHTRMHTRTMCSFVWHQSDVINQSLSTDECNWDIQLHRGGFVLFRLNLSTKKDTRYGPLPSSGLSH